MQTDLYSRSRSWLLRRGRFLALASLPILVLGGVQSARTATSPPAPPAVPAPNLCPYTTPEEWQRFLERYANNEKWVETCEDSTCDADYYDYVKRNVQETFEVCRGFLDQHPEIARCTDNMRRFTPPWLRQHDATSYGFDVDNHVYLGSQDAADKPPGMMTVPAAIVQALPDRDRVENAARLNGWKYLTHDSALGGYRTFVIVSDPQGRFDQWMLLNLKQGSSSVTQDTPMSILVVQKKDAAGNRLSHVRLHFRDYTIEHRESGYTVNLHETNNGKCYSCHANGMRQLIARRTPILQSKPSRGEPGFKEQDDGPADPEFSFQRLMELNKKIRSYGNPDWNGMIHPENHGPALGQAQGCIDCHDGKTRGILTVATSHDQVQKKILLELSMPPDTDLPRWIERNEMQDPVLTLPEQRSLKKALEAHEDLLRDFEASRFTELKKWFLQTSCR